MLVNKQQLQRAWYLFAVVALFVVMVCSVMSAQAQFEDIGGELGAPAEMTGVCGPTDVLTYTVTIPELQNGDVAYLKTNAANLTSNIEVFVQDESGRCTRWNETKANDKNWTKLGTVTSKVSGTNVTVILASPNLGADIYASVATILLVPPNTCSQVKVGCTSELQSENGIIEPTNVSSPGEFVTVQTVSKLDQEDILYVEYYDGGEFLYAKPTIEAVDSNYLRGGERTVKKAVYLSNNRLFTITEKVGMPNDPLYSQYLKSSFYRLGGQARLALTIIGAVILIFAIRWLIRRLHAWRTYRNGHGIDTYLRTHHED